MTRATIAGGAFAVLGLPLLFAACHADRGEDAEPVAEPLAEPMVEAAPAPAMTPWAAWAHADLLYGRVTTDDGTVYEGRLRWGGDEEALWGNYFNGFKDDNPWAEYVPAERLPRERHSFELLGIEIAWGHKIDLGRPFMARMGDIARIDPHGTDLQVTLKSGTVFHLDRFSADDLADGLRVWDASRGVVDLGEWSVRSVELLPTAPLGTVPRPIYGTVRTRDKDFTGFLQWDREACLDLDELSGYTDEGELRLRFDAIRSIARLSSDSSLVTLLDGREIKLSGTRQVGEGNRGIYVDDARYGRVLVSWDAFERVDLSPGGTGPAYGDFPPGSPLRGSVLTRSGRRFSGRLVYDLDESETTETHDAPSQGVDYTIPFSLIKSIELPGVDGPDALRARVTLRSGEELPLELSGDLGEGNAGLLVFFDGRSEAGERLEYVPWPDVKQIDLDGGTL